MALKQFGCKVGEGVCTDMKAVRKDYFLDHDHSAYVDQWDWERAITEKDRNLDFLKDVVKKIWKVLYGASQHAQEQFPALQTSKYPDIPEELQFFHAEEILDRYPDLPRKQRETKMIQEVAPAIFIIGIGWVLKDGYPHEMRAADYDDWAVRVTKETLKVQLKISGQEDFLKLPYHQAILNDEIPLSIGGGIGQSRTYMYLLRTAHIGEVSVTVWPKELKDICAARNIQVLE
jgi:aspartate--ammonia ligase